MKRQRERASLPHEQQTRLVYATGGGETPAAPRGADARAPARPQPPGVRLRLERRASGRLVTLVSGLPGSAAELAAAASELRAACGAGGTLKDDLVELQGDQRERVETWLAARGLRFKRAGG